ncbi:hypothetical protein GBA52_029007 [Prunus armeniaca]|nr:hypothetical protein GBA52_029007 [Prunus armeniaca]
MTGETSRESSQSKPCNVDRSSVPFVGGSSSVTGRSHIPSPCGAALLPLPFGTCHETAVEEDDEDGELWTQLGSVTASMMFAYAMFKQFFPDDLGNILEKYTQKLVGYVYPYIQISFDEYTVEFLRRSEVYSSIQSYLSTKSSTRAKRLKAHDVKGSKALVLGMDDNEEVTDEFQGIKLWWVSMKSASKKSSFSFYPEYEDRKQYKLTFHRRHRDIVMGSYLDHVRQEGKAIAVSNRQRKLYINNTGKAKEEEARGGKRWG